MNEIANKVRCGVARLRPGQGVCRCCGGPAPPLAVSAYDAGQAFEMVTEGEVMCGYRAAWQHFAAVTGEPCISVGRGRRY